MVNIARMVDIQKRGLILPSLLSKSAVKRLCRYRKRFKTSSSPDGTKIATLENTKDSMLPKWMNFSTRSATISSLTG